MTSFDDFPTVLLPARAFFALSDYGAVNSGLYRFDANGYRMYPLYSGLLPEFERPNSVSILTPCRAVAGPGTDITEFLRLLQWLTNEYNYGRLFYGVAGVDYTLTPERRIVPLETEVEWFRVRKILSPFENPAFAPVPLSAPNNYEDALASIRHPRRITLTAGDEAALAEWWADEDTNLRNANVIWNDGNWSFDVMFNAVDLPDEAELARLLDEFFARQRDLAPTVLDYLFLAQTALTNAEIQ